MNDDKHPVEAADLVSLTADIVSAYLTSNKIEPTAVADLIIAVHSSMKGLGAPKADVSEKVSSAAARKSVRPDAIVSFLDKRPYKSLRRHLSANGMTPEDYREKFGLPADYPMVAAEYSAARSELARSLGLGRKPAPAPEPEAKAPRKRQGVKKAA